MQLCRGTYELSTRSQKGVQSITGALSFVGLNQVFTYAIGQAVVLPSVLPILKREASSNLYPLSAWYLR